MSTWYLVYVVTGQFLGPLPEHVCRSSSADTAGIVCKQPSYMMGCAVDGRPGVTTACPVFEPTPKVGIKP
jgi:hypothetical protein